jgi:hypothetical protein
MEYRVKVPEQVPEKFHKIAEMIRKRYNLHVRKFTRAELLKGGKGREIFNIVNATYKDLYGYSQLSEKQIIQLVDQYIKVVDYHLLTAIEDWNTPDHDIVGVGISMTSMTRALQKCHKGRLFPFGWWHCMRALKFHKAECVDLMLVGILPEYQQKGANALLFYDLIPIYQRYGFKWGETNVEMETNDKVQSQWQYLEREQHKRRRCFRKTL